MSFLVKLLLALFTETVYLHRVVCHLETELFGYGLLSFFYLFIHKLGDLPAFCAYHMVVVIFGAEFILFPLCTK